MRVPDKLLALELRLLSALLFLARLGGRLRQQAHPRALPLRQPLRPRQRRLRCRAGQPARGEACGDEGLGEEELLARGGAGAQAVDGRAADQQQIARAQLRRDVHRALLEPAQLPALPK